MFILQRENFKKLVKNGICCAVLGLFFWSIMAGFGVGSPVQAGSLEAGNSNEVLPEDIIRFHVIANSDSEEDQLLKYAVRDAILKKAAPRLAQSASLAESRAILLEMEEDITGTAKGVIQAWGKDYPVSLDYGKYSFPTKSYGNIVLPGGEYEAVKIKIGRAAGTNWWCILFPPLCFVNVEKATSLPVDGKAGVPVDSVKKEAAAKSGSKESDGIKSDSIKSDSNKIDSNKTDGDKSGHDAAVEPSVLTTYKGKKVGLFIERFFR